ncbi:MAG: hypothetical protein E7354_04870 [Clostridiales bacterium]|nr:hypothetical protein [Clostridiales bacterium]
MKKIRAIKYISIALFIWYISLIVMAYKTQYFEDKSNLYFSLLLASISLIMSFKGVVLKSYSTLWFALSLILYALIIILLEMKNIDYNSYKYFFILLPIVASLILVAFGQKVYLKVVILNVSVAIPMLLDYFIELQIWLYIVVFIISVLIGILLCRTFGFDKETV